jgi:putative addiction module CopG family antidote
MELTLTPDLEESIQREIDRGHFKTPAEVLKSALRLLREEEEHIVSLRQTLDAKLDESEAAVARGETISGEELEAELDKWRARVLCQDIA